MAGKIFINYRRGDDPAFTQALHQRLEDEFTADDLFMDVEGHIKPGDDFVAVLNAQVVATDVLLAVIGPRWSELLMARANDPDDFVAIEIKAALENNKRVIPSSSVAQECRVPMRSVRIFGSAAGASDACVRCGKPLQNGYLFGRAPL